MLFSESIQSAAHICPLTHTFMPLVLFTHHAHTLVLRSSMTFQHATYETAEVGMGVALTTHLVGPPQDQNSELGINEMKIKKI